MSTERLLSSPPTQVAEERITTPPTDGLVTAAPHFAASPAAAEQDGAAPALLVALLQEYAEHHAPIAEARRKRRALRIPVLGAGAIGLLVFTVCAIWMVIELAGPGAVRPPRSEPPWLIGMIFGGFETFLQL